MYMEQLSQALSIAAKGNYTVLNNNTLNTGNGIDMAQFKRVMFIILTQTVGGSLTPIIQGATASGGSFNTVTTGAAITGNNKVATLEIRDDQCEDTNRFIRCQVTETGSVNSGCEIIALAAEGDHKPVNSNDIADVVYRTVT